jgi:Zn-finger domain-containing protein
VGRTNGGDGIMANKFLESFNKANDKLSLKDFKSKTGKGGYYPAKKKLLLNEITKLGKIIGKGADKSAYYARDNLLERLDSVEQAMGLPEAKTPLSQIGELRQGQIRKMRKRKKKAGGGKVYAMNRRTGGSIRKPRMK